MQSAQQDKAPAEDRAYALELTLLMLLRDLALGKKGRKAMRQRAKEIDQILSRGGASNVVPIRREARETYARAFSPGRIAAYRDVRHLLGWGLGENETPLP